MSTEKRRVAYTLDSNLVADIDRLAERHGVSGSTLVEAAVRRWLLDLPGSRPEPIPPLPEPPPPSTS